MLKIKSQCVVLATEKSKRKRKPGDDSGDEDENVRRFNLNTTLPSQKYMADLLAAEKRLNADHTKEWKTAQTLAGKRHALAKKMINSRFLSLKRRYAQADKDAKMEAAEIF